MTRAGVWFLHEPEAGKGLPAGYDHIRHTEDALGRIREAEASARESLRQAMIAMTDAQEKPAPPADDAAEKLAQAVGGFLDKNSKDDAWVPMAPAAIQGEFDRLWCALAAYRAAHPKGGGA